MDRIKQVEPFSQIVSEADVDWIVCVELNANAAFREWFAKEIFGSESLAHDRAWRSISCPESGESDLVWRVRTADGSFLLALIENKINAIAQPEQCLRYVRRGESYVRDNVCGDFRTVLLSPNTYVSSDSSNYQVHISYESLRTWFASCEGERPKFLVSILESAIHKLRFSPSPDPAITAYREQVWKLANSEFPAINLRKPGPTREYWIAQSYDGVWLRYKSYFNLREGFHSSVVDMELPGHVDDVDHLKDHYGSDLCCIGAKVVKAGQSAAFRIEVPSAKPPEFDEVVTRSALQAWEALLNWWDKLPIVRRRYLQTKSSG